MARRKGGHPPRLTPAVHAEIVATVRATGNFTEAASLAGVHHSTLRNWRRLGERVSDPEHPEHIADPTPFEAACSRLVVDVEQALDHYAQHLRARIAEAAHTQRKTVVTTTKWIVVNGTPQQVVERREVVEPPSLKAATFLLDRIDPPTQKLDVSGEVVVDLAERAARARASIAALRGLPVAGDELDEADEA